jgi:hypothetical protein
VSGPPIVLSAIGYAVNQSQATNALL